MIFFNSTPVRIFVKYNSRAMMDIYTKGSKRYRSRKIFIYIYNILGYKDDERANIL